KIPVFYEDEEGNRIDPKKAARPTPKQVLDTVLLRGSSPTPVRSPESLAGALDLDAEPETGNSVPIKPVPGGLGSDRIIRASQLDRKTVASIRASRARKSEKDEFASNSLIESEKDEFASNSLIESERFGPPILSKIPYVSRIFERGGRFQPEA